MLPLSSLVPLSLSSSTPEWSFASFSYPPGIESSSLNRRISGWFKVFRLWVGESPNIYRQSISCTSPRFGSENFRFYSSELSKRCRIRLVFHFSEIYRYCVGVCLGGPPKQCQGISEKWNTKRTRQTFETSAEQNRKFSEPKLGDVHEIELPINIRRFSGKSCSCSRRRFSDSNSEDESPIQTRRFLRETQAFAKCGSIFSRGTWLSPKSFERYSHECLSDVVSCWAVEATQIPCWFSTVGSLAQWSSLDALPVQHRV